MALDKAAILAANDIEMASIDIPEWGGEVFVKGMNGKQRGIFETASVDFVKNNKPQVMSEMREKIACWCLVDETGKRLFNDADAPKLAEKSSEVLDRIFEKVLELSKISVPKDELEQNF